MINGRQDLHSRPNPGTMRPPAPPPTGHPFQSDVLRAGPLEIHPTARQVLVHGERISLGSRAFDLLLLLAGAAGRVVAHDEIQARVWPNRFVSETNLRVQISTLRRALGDARHVITTVPDRGYAFTPFETEGTDTDAPAPRPAGVDSHVVHVVDDEADMRDALASLLMASGWEARTYGSVRAFQAALTPQTGGCLLLDVSLPGESGLELQRHLLAQGIAMPIIFLSGRSNIPIAVEAMKAGAIEFLTKPASGPDILAAVERAMALALSGDAPQAGSLRP